MVQDFFHQEYAYIPLKLTAKHLKIRGFVNGEPSLPFENPTFCSGCCYLFAVQGGTAATGVLFVEEVEVVRNDLGGGSKIS